MTSLEQRLQALGTERLRGMRRGLEKESLRAQPDGKLALTPHPVALGSALTHPHITTDYSESQLELITGVHASVQGCLNELTEIHQFVLRTLKAQGDERLWVPIVEGVYSKPVWISPARNMWADVLMSKSAGLVNRHYHPLPVWAYTISGKWGYLEHDWIATAGDFVYETPGEGHTLVSYEHPDPMRVFFIVKGPLIWLDEKGGSVGHFDVHDYIKLCRDHYEKVGIGAGYVDTLFR